MRISLYFFILSKLDFQNIWQDLFSFDFTVYKLFEALIKHVYQEPYDFLTINLSEIYIDKKYTRNLTCLNSTMFKSFEDEISVRAHKLNKAYQATQETARIYAANKLGVIETQRKTDELFNPIVQATLQAGKSSSDKVETIKKDLSQDVDDA